MSLPGDPSQLTFDHRKKGRFLFQSDLQKDTFCSPKIETLTWFYNYLTFYLHLSTLRRSPPIGIASGPKLLRHERNPNKVYSLRRPNCSHVSSGT